MLAVVGDLDSIEGARTGASEDLGRPDFVITTVDGDEYRFDVFGRSHPTAAEIPATDPERRCLVVADRLTVETRRELQRRRISYFDRRGKLVLVLDGRTIEADVASLDRPHRRALAGPVRGVSGISLAYACLLTPRRIVRGAPVARAAGLTAAAISQARAKLRDAHLLDDHGLPVLPDLFDELVRAWHWPAVTATVLPSWDDPLLAAAGACVEGPWIDSLDELDHVLRRDRRAPVGVTAWAASGPQAAAAYGAPIMVGEYAPLQVIVPAERFRIATAAAAAAAQRGATRPAQLTAAPTPLAVQLRRRGDDGTPLAHPLTVALDLALDPGRGREMLRSFRPTGVEHVWR